MTEFCDCGDYPNGSLRRAVDCPTHRIDIWCEDNAHMLEYLAPIDVVRAWENYRQCCGEK